LFEERQEAEFKEERSPLQRAFPVFPAHDFEMFVNRSPYQIGVDRGYPAELRKRISAAVLSYCMQLSSVDYTRKRYLQNADYSHEEEEHDGFRFDIRIRRTVRLELEALYFAHSFGKEKYKGEPLAGLVVGNATLARLPFAMGRAISEADRGALFEAIAIMRMIVEQLSWVAAISSLDDSSEIRSTPVTGSLKYLRDHVPFSGRLYGWMSDHAHWSFSAHTKAIDLSSNQILLANSRFKALAYAAILATTATTLMAIKSLRRDFIDPNVLKRAREDRYITEVFSPVDLLRSINEIVDDDIDVQTIISMVCDYR
jgi:hypothetical protein